MSECWDGALGSSGCHSLQVPHSHPAEHQEWPLLAEPLVVLQAGISWKSSSVTLSFARGHQLLKLDAGIQVCVYPTPQFGCCGSELFIHPCLKVIPIPWMLHGVWCSSFLLS